MTGNVRADWQVSVLRQGAEAQPLVAIDGFVREPDDWRETAAMLAFRPMGEHYPGVRAPVPAALLRPLIAALEPVVQQVFALDALEVVDSFFSLVTTPPAALRPIQRLPHFDEVSPTRLALLHYLAPDEASGTAFFRHRATGWESVDATRLAEYDAALARETARIGLPSPGYLGGDTALFEQIARHAGCFNRAILYRSNTLHCASIPSGMAFSADPLTGRLTVNTFLDARPL